MKKNLNHYWVLLVLFTMTFLVSEAAVQTNLNDEVQALVIQKKGKQSKLKKYQTFKVGEDIVYQTKQNKEDQKGKITGFDGNQIIITDVSGNTQKVTVEDLQHIRRKSTFLTFVSAVLLICFIGFIILTVLAVYVLTVPFTEPAPFGLGTLLIPSIASAFTGLFGFLGLRKYKTFIINDEWKAVIKSIEN